METIIVQLLHFCLPKKATGDVGIHVCPRAYSARIPLKNPKLRPTKDIRQPYGERKRELGLPMTSRLDERNADEVLAAEALRENCVFSMQKRDMGQPAGADHGASFHF